MKLLFSLLFGGLSSLALFAQPVSHVAPVPAKERTIEVTGSAELEIVPDEVYLSVTLREYMKDKSKVRLDDIDKNFRKALADLKIDMKDVSIESASGYYNWDDVKKRNTEFMASKTYIVKLPDLNRYNDLMARLDKNGADNVYLKKTDHSKIEEYRRQVKVQALQAAKEKAKQLLEGIGEQVGEVIFIREVAQNYNYPMYKMEMANRTMAADVDGEDEGMSAELQKITLRYEVEAHFRIR